MGRTKLLCGDITEAYWERFKNSIEGGYRNQRRSPAGMTLIDLTPEFLWEMYEKQNGKCALSGTPITISTGARGTASLDRVDSKQGYSKSNVQWVHKNINMMKQSFSQEHFISLCLLVAANNKVDNA
jgi:hypothetical protein